jgi:hypothetical protein
MSWLTRNLGWIVTLAALLAGGAVGYGRLCQTASTVQNKADKDAVTHDMGLLRADLARVEGKLDKLIELHIPHTQ